MEATRKLLQADPQSEMARAVRAGLIGLRAMLDDAAGRCSPDDASLAPGRDLIAQIDALLAAPEQADEPAGDAAATPPGAAPEPTVNSATGQASPVDVPQAHPDQALNALAAALADAPELAEYLDPATLAMLRSPPRPDAGPAGEPSAGPELIWRMLHLCLLRLPEQLADGWRRKAADLATEPTAQAAWQILPGEADAILVPPRAAAAEGIRTSPQAALDAEVLAAVGPASGWPAEHAADIAELARLSSLVLGFMTLDDNLVVCLESVLFKGAKRLDDRLRQQYRVDLLARLREYARSEPASAAALAALIEIDEAINSLTHRPPAAPGSWWAQVHQLSRRVATRAASALRDRGTDVDVLPLGLGYADVRDFTRGNDVASRSGGKPGDVLACLRLWARIEGKTTPGRVIYRM